MQTDKIDITERMKHYNVTGISIAEIKNGAVHATTCYGVLEAGTNKHVTGTSIFNACSISKFVTSMLVMVLCEKGILSLEEDVNNQLTSWQISENEFQTTLRDLLSHQAGIIDPEGSFHVVDEHADVPAIRDILNGETLYCNERIEIKVVPKTEFHYSDAGFCIIQQVIEDRCGKPFEEVMKEYIFEALQMKNSSYPQAIIDEDVVSCGHHKNGEVVEERYPIYPYAATAGLWTTPTDLSYIVMELMNALKGKSAVGLSSKLATEMITSYGCKEWAGLGCFLDKTEQGIEIVSFGWGVGFQCLFVAYPHQERALIIMTNTDLGVHQLEGIIGEIVKAYV